MLSDKEIIELFWARNPDAVKEVHRIYGRKLMGIAQRILLIQEDAKECVNDTYYKTWATIPPTRPRNLYAYLSKICRNTALGMLDWKNAAKRKAEVVSLTKEMESCIPDSGRNLELEEKELGRILSEFLRTLSPENRMIFLRRYWYADTGTEIAKRYGLSEGAVMTRLSRTRTKLKKYLNEKEIAI